MQQLGQEANLPEEADEEDDGEEESEPPPKSDAILALEDVQHSLRAEDT